MILGVQDQLKRDLDELFSDRPTSPECDDGKHAECGGGYARTRTGPTFPCRCPCGHPHLRKRE